MVANGGIAIAKLVAAVVTGSGAMLAESVHSFADTGNQGLLLLGHHRAKQPADERHPLGYGREAYFWAMLVAGLLFTMGGLFSLNEAIHKLNHPEPLKSPEWAIGVLVVGLFLEGYSLRAAWLEFGARRGRRGLMRWARHTGDVNLLVVLFEDMAAMAGLVIALIAVVLTTITGDPLYDALGTAVIGVLLLVVAVFLGAQLRRLIAGFTVDEETRDDIRRIWHTNGFDVLQLIAVWIGPQRMIVVMKVRPRAEIANPGHLVLRLNEVEELVRDQYPQIMWHFVEPEFVH